MGLTEADSLVSLLAGPVLEAAHGILGMRLRSEIGGEIVEVALTEVEAYGGAEDAASHAHRGRTARNTSMFAAPGTAYVYRSYGVHWCLNVAAGPEGVGSAVLLRGAVPLVGESVIVRRRGRSDHLTDGPGKLCQSLGVTGEQDGVSLLDGRLRLLPGEPMVGTVLATPRIGITKAENLPWRFVVAKTAGAMGDAGPAVSP